MVSYDGIEKREFLRIEYDAPINYRIWELEKVQSMPLGAAKNISACGILFSVKKHLDVGTILVLKLDDHTLGDIVEIDDSVLEMNSNVLGRVVRVEEVVPDKNFELGVCFIRKDEASDDEDIQKILKAIE